VVRRNPLPRPPRQAGLTLIETLVVLTIFTIISFIAVSSIVSIVRNQQKTSTTNETYASAQQVMNQITQVIRRSRAVVTHVDTNPDTDPADCVTNCLALVQNDGSRVIFRMGGDGAVEELANSLTDPTPERLSSPAVRVQNLNFVITDVDPAALPPPAVTVSFTSEAATNSTGRTSLSASISLESTVVLRAY
jgi:prepilin-type N-terminal cleavage/methylation domain-containing protein